MLSVTTVEMLYDASRFLPFDNSSQLNAVRLAEPPILDAVALSMSPVYEVSNEIDFAYAGATGVVIDSFWTPNASLDSKDEECVPCSLTGSAADYELILPNLFT